MTSDSRCFPPSLATLRRFYLKPLPLLASCSWSLFVLFLLNKQDNLHHQPAHLITSEGSPSFSSRKVKNRQNSMSDVLLHKYLAAQQQKISPDCSFTHHSFMFPKNLILLILVLQKIIVLKSQLCDLQCLKSSCSNKAGLRSSDLETKPDLL